MATAASDEGGQFGTMIAYCRGKFVAALAMMAPQSDGDFPVVLSITTGKHAGCVTQIDGSRFTIGDDLTDDIMLTDPDMDGPAVAITSRQTLFGWVLTVRSERADVRLNKILLAQGVGHERLPCTLSIGSVKLSIKADTSVPKITPARTEVSIILCLVLVGIFGLTVPSWLPVARGTVLQAADTTVFSQPQADQNAPLSAIMDAEIAGADLSNYITARPGLDNTVNLSGAVPAGLMTQWRDLLARFDTAAYAPRLIVTVKQATELGNLPAISIVQLGDDPKLLLSSGRAIGLGDKMVENWSIDAITATGVTLSRAGEVIEVTY